MSSKTFKPATRSELAHLYGVSTATMKKWLDKIPDLSLDIRIRVLTPKQIEHIVTHLGNPPD